MDELIRILEDVNDGYDYLEEKNLFSEHKLDSFDLVGLISDIKEAFSVEIPAFLITEENFDSAQAIYKLILQLKEGD